MDTEKVNKNIDDLKIGDTVVDLCINTKNFHPKDYLGKIVKLDYNNQIVHITYSYPGGYSYMGRLATYGKFWVLESDYVKPNK